MNKLSVIIPARNEAENLPNCITEICEELIKNSITYEILVIDDGSTDNTTKVINNIKKDFESVICIKNKNENGFGRATRLGLENFSGDAVAIMMADRSDSPRDLVEYWNVLNSGLNVRLAADSYEGSKIYDYPKLKLLMNRIVNVMIKYAFNINCNDVTNAFKMYKREVIEGCKPFHLPSFQPYC